MAVNAASRSVMRKLGMRHTRTESRAEDGSLPGSGQQEVSYEMTAQDWRAAPAPGSRSH
jgi:RimJ/RimL family protein N-acetyltransferase